MTWRYDPIVLSSCTPADFHLERFAAIAGALEGAVRRVYFSFVDFYGKTRRNFERVSGEQGIRFFDPRPTRGETSYCDFATSQPAAA